MHIEIMQHQVSLTCVGWERCWAHAATHIISRIFFRSIRFGRLSINTCFERLKNVCKRENIYGMQSIINSLNNQSCKKIFSYLNIVFDRKDFCKFIILSSRTYRDTIRKKAFFGILFEILLLFEIILDDIVLLL